MVNFSQLVILAAAWWYEKFTNPICARVFDLFFIPGLKHWPRYAHPIANFFSEYLVSFLLAEPLAFLIAENYLRDKWAAELLEENRLYELTKNRMEGLP